MENLLTNKVYEDVMSDDTNQSALFNLKYEEC